jgi:ribosomal protein S17
MSKSPRAVRLLYAGIAQRVPRSLKMKKFMVDHPHFTIFPGDGVEIMECLPIPDMPK